MDPIARPLFKGLFTAAIVQGYGSWIVPLCLSVGLVGGCMLGGFTFGLISATVFGVCAAIGVSQAHDSLARQEIQKHSTRAPSPEFAVERAQTRFLENELQRREQTAHASREI